MKKLLVSMLLMCFLVSSFSTLAFAAPAPPPPDQKTIDHGYGVKEHITTLYFNSKLEAYAFIDGKSQPSYSSYVDFIVGAGFSALHPAVGVAYGIFYAAFSAGQSSIINGCKADVQNLHSSSRPAVKVTKWDNPRGGGINYSFYCTVGAWTPGAMPWSIDDKVEITNDSQVINEDSILNRARTPETEQ